MRQQNRLTWGGLMRILARCKVPFEKNHIRCITREGYTRYLNIKYDASGVPYFIELPPERR